jgi:hypothetical protein
VSNWTGTSLKHIFQLTSISGGNHVFGDIGKPMRKESAKRSLVCALPAHGWRRLRAGYVKMFTFARSDGAWRGLQA